jgi:hypothetical protein
VIAANHATRRSKTIHFDVIRLRAACKAAGAGRTSANAKMLRSLDFNAPTTLDPLGAARFDDILSGALTTFERETDRCAVAALTAEIARKIRSG